MNHLNKLVIAFFFFLVSCGDNVTTSPSKQDVEATFLLLMEEATNHSYGKMPGISMSIISPKLDTTWEGVIGYDSDKKEDSLQLHQPFRIASVTKTFVAAAILRLHEMGKISINESITKYISEEHINILEKEGYEPNKIKISHCLNHTSGLFDFGMGEGSSYLKIAKENPIRRWTRTEQLQGAMDWGNKMGAPGERYHYSDTGYILLGEIIEYFYNGDLALGLRTLLKMEQLGMKNTWLGSLEARPINTNTDVEVVHRYFQGDDVTKWDNSVDLYGGGGLMSTCPDLNKFIHALFNHQVFDKKATLELMLTKPTYAKSYDIAADKRYKDYRYGLWEITIYGEKAYLHKGLWGTIVLHIPAYNSSFTANFTKGWSDRLLKKAILVIKNLDS